MIEDTESGSRNDQVGPLEPVATDTAGVDGGGLYSYAATTEVGLNTRTATALDVWFADPNAVDVPGLGSVAPRPRPTLVRVCESARWGLGAATVALLIPGWIVGVEGMQLLGVVGAATLAGTGGIVADRFARRARTDSAEQARQADQLARARMRYVQAHPAPPELKIVLHAAQAVSDIEHNRAFTDDVLADHRRRVDFDDEVARLARDARDLWIARRRLVECGGFTTADAAPLLAVLAAQERDLSAVWSAIETRAQAVDRYLAAVRDLEPHLDYLGKLEAAAAHSDTIADLRLRTVEQAAGTPELDAMVVELTAVRDAITEVVRGLDRDAAIIARGGDTAAVDVIGSRASRGAATCEKGDTSNTTR